MFNFFKKIYIDKPFNSKTPELIKDTFIINQSEIELVLLNEFMNPKFANRVLAYWSQDIQQTVFEKLISTGDLIKPPIESIINVAYKITDLKKILLDNKLSVTGNKQVLIERIIINNIAYGEVPNNIYECSHAAKQRVETWLEERRITEFEVVNKVVDFLKKRNVVDAYKVRNGFKKNHPARSDFCEVNNPLTIKLPSETLNKEIELILGAKPKLLSYLSHEDLERIKLSTALLEMGFFGSSLEIPMVGFIGSPRFPSARLRHLIHNHEQYLLNHEVLKRSGIKEFEVFAYDRTTLCANCAKYIDKTLTVDDLPEIPNPNCLEGWGKYHCGLSYKPILSFDE